MKKSHKARTTPSMMRSAFKKTMQLPSPKMYDPFIGKNFYINANGRVIVDGKEWKT